MSGTGFQELEQAPPRGMETRFEGEQDEIAAEDIAVEAAE